MNQDFLAIKFNKQMFSLVGIITLIISVVGISILSRNTNGDMRSHASESTLLNNNLNKSAPAVCNQIWTKESPYPIKIEENTVVSVGGALYSFGGYADRGNGFPIETAQSFKYYPETNQWKEIASLPTTRRHITSTTDGVYIYLVGGIIADQATTSVLRYDTSTNSYTELAPLAYPLITSVVFLNGKIYRMAGCREGNCMSPFFDRTVGIYDIASNSWSTTHNPPPILPLAMLTTLNNYIYTAGGLMENGEATTKTYRYDPSLDKWEDDPIADLPYPRYIAAHGIVDNTWIIAGGRNNTYTGAVTDTLAWDPLRNTWSMRAPLAEARDYFSDTSVIGSQLYAVGGGLWNTLVGTRDNQRYNCSSILPTITPTQTLTPIMPSLTPLPTPSTYITSYITPTPGIPGESWIYIDNGLINNWRIFQNAIDLSLVDTSFVHQGLTSIGITFRNGGRNVGASITRTPISTSNYHALELYINGGDASNQSISINIQSLGPLRSIYNPLNNYIEGGSLAQDTWRKVFIPFGDWNTQNEGIYNLQFNNLSIHPQPRFYIDDVRMVCQGDANGDGVINAQDVTIYRAEEGICTHNCKADFNNDGRTDSADFNILKNKIGTACQ